MADVGVEADLQVEPKMARMKWTEEEEKILNDLTGKEILPDIMGRVLGRSENSIRSKLKQMGLEVPTTKANIDYELYKRLMEPEVI